MVVNFVVRGECISERDHCPRTPKCSARSLSRRMQITCKTRRLAACTTRYECWQIFRPGIKQREKTCFSIYMCFMARWEVYRPISAAAAKTPTEKWERERNVRPGSSAQCHTAQTATQGHEMRDSPQGSLLHVVAPIHLQLSAKIKHIGNEIQQLMKLNVLFLVPAAKLLTKSLLFTSKSSKLCPLTRFFMSWESD